MPYLEGETLRERLEREAQLPIEEALRITSDVAGALGHAHSRGIIHRHLKPENILLSYGHTYVSDFGIARAIAAAAGERLTETGIILGTPAYMSPEQARESSELDGRSDIYSLGCVLFEMLTGYLPFTGAPPQIMMARHLSDPVPPVRAARPEIPRHVESAVTKAMAKTPAGRFSTAAEFSAALINAE